MALPTLSKTWEHSVNTAAATSTADEDDCDATILAMVNALIDGGTFTVPWTVVASSDSVTADASNNWLDIGDIVHAAAPTAHSWIVLEAPTGDLQICFDTGFTNSLPERWGVYVSFTAGFTGGTTTARPTATDEFELSAASTNIFPTSTFNSKVHCTISDDGEQTRLFVNIGGNTIIALIVGELADTDGLVDPTAIIWGPITNGVSETLDLFQLWSGCRTLFNDAGTVAAFRCSGEAVQNGTSDTTFQSLVGFNATNAQNGEWHLGPVGAWGPQGTAQAGKLGNLPDLFWGSETNHTGDQYPDVGTTFQFTQFGVFVVPWDSTNAAQVA